MERRPHIMVIDDDRDLLEVVSHALRLKGYTVSLTSDSTSALALMDECQPDLVLLDIVMPKIDGFQLLYLIRQRSTVPVIMLSVIGEVTWLEKALRLGADDYIKKPFGIRVLTARIEAKLRRAQSGGAGYREGRDFVVWAQ